MLRSLPILICLILGGPGAAKAGEVRIAVASNFAPALAELTEQFEQLRGESPVLISGSTGKLYAQIRNGAPFDAFFAADRQRPQLLEIEGVSVPGSRFTYARGRLVLWGRSLDALQGLREVLHEGQFRHLAMANPDLAPYGFAAREVLMRLDTWAGLQGRLVLGENIAQAFQFVYSGNAELGLLALSQLRTAGHLQESWIEVPAMLHSPIEQQAVLLRESARPFFEFTRSDEGRAIIQAQGYDIP